MENKICIFMPYFGKFNNFFNLWVYSASKNNKIDFYIISDSFNKKSVPAFNNIHFIESTLDEIKCKFSSYFGFDCSLESGYKLCDYRPFYFILYPEIISKYDYWGFGDMDLIYGDIMSFLPDNLCEYDAFFQYGHLQLIKNTPEVNNLVFKYAGVEKIKEVYSTNKPCFFDEREFSRFNLAKKANLRVYDNQDVIGDIYSYSPVLRLVRNYKTNQAILFEFNNGRMFGHEIIDDKLVSNEYVYLHLQKRKMTNNVKNFSLFYINGSKFFNKKNKNLLTIVKTQKNKRLLSKIRIFINLRLKPKLNKK